MFNLVGMETDTKKNKTPFVSLPHAVLDIFLSDIKFGKKSEGKLNYTDFIVYVLFLKTFNKNLGMEFRLTNPNTNEFTTEAEFNTAIGASIASIYAASIS